MDRIDFVPDGSVRAIHNIQRKLASLEPHDGQDLRIANYSGLYDDATRKALKSFQRKHGIEPADGICDRQTWCLLNEQAGTTFAETWQFEIDSFRAKRPPDEQMPLRETLATEAHEEQLAGLALSGGGIRSATFGLGILQALGELQILDKLHYLSTVSGGGYIGAWFSKWLHCMDGNIHAIEKKLTPGSPSSRVSYEPEQIKFLRQYSNYLTPKTGAFSADTWALLATYVRNTMLNLTILVALLAAVLMLPRVLVALIGFAGLGNLQIPFSATMRGFSWFEAIAIAAALWSVFWIAASISMLPDARTSRMWWAQSQTSIIRIIVIPLMLAAFTGSAALWQQRRAIEAAWTSLYEAPDLANPILVWLVAPGVAYFVFWAAGWTLSQIHNFHLTGPGRPQPLTARYVWRQAVGHLTCAIVALAVGTVLVIKTVSALSQWLDSDGWASAELPIPLTAFGMPILLSLFGITMVLSVGLVGQLYTDKSREWWARQSGWTAIFVVGWLALATASLYGAAALRSLDASAKALWGSAWFASTVAGLIVGKLSPRGAGTKARLKWLAAVAPPVFCAGAVCLVALLVDYLLPLESYADPQVADRWRTVLALLGAAIAFAAAGFMLGWRVDINKFSLHMMYRNRLVRAYLGASNQARRGHPFTGFDPTDEIFLDELLTNAQGQLQRPYHIINTALNLVHGEELAWQTRKAGNFTFTPAYCGFELPAMAAPGGPKLAHQAMRGGFRRTCAYRPTDPRPEDEERGIKLGMAMAVSGAAASPSMGNRSSPALAFLMTLFNVRLGRWFINPTRPPFRQARKATAAGTVAHSAPRISPKVGIWHLVNELFGLTDANSDYVYLSDGGHFENLGIYELVRRRCRLIVAVDAGADGQFDFGDLGNVIRKCGTDLHIEIEIKVGQIDLQKPSEFSKAHCVTGKIRYDKIDPGAPFGTLLYIKPTLLGTEFADILNYRKINKGFPHQSTADAWFDESQFEAYRSLGYQIGKEALEKATHMVRAQHKGAIEIEALCEALRAIWNRTGDHVLGERDLKVVPHRGPVQRRKYVFSSPDQERRHTDERRSA